MATQAASRLTSTYLDQPYPMAGFHEEVWRVASGAAAGDTVVITPARGRYVVVAQCGPATDDVGTVGTNTNVTLTVVAGTSTIGSFNVTILVQD